MSQLQTVVQPLRDVTSALRDVLQPSFGPNALKVLLKSGSGKIMTTSSGVMIINSMNLEHPMAKLLMRAIEGFHSTTGDGVKTFVFVVHHILDMISKSYGEQRECLALYQGLIHYERTLITSVLPKALENLHKTENNDVDHFDDDLTRILETYFCGQFSSLEAKHLSSLITDVIVTIRSNIQAQSFKELESTFKRTWEVILQHTVQCPGNGINSTRFVLGIIMKQTFLTTSSQLMENIVLKYIIVNSLGFESNEETQYVIKGNQRSVLLESLVFKEKLIAHFVQSVLKLEITLILYSGKAEELLVNACRVHDIALIHYVSDEHLELLQQHTAVILHWRDLTYPNVRIGSLTNCSEVVLNGHRCVHLQFVTSDARVTCPDLHQLLICAPTDGLCSQVLSAVKNSFKVVHQWLFSCNILHRFHMGSLKCNSGVTPIWCGHSVLGGGAFELTLSHVLEEIMDSSAAIDDSARTWCKIWASSLNMIVTVLLKNSFAREHNRLNLLLSKQTHFKQSTVFGIEAVGGKTVILKNEVLEALGSKIQLVLDVLVFLKTVLKIDGCFHVLRLPQCTRNDSDDNDDG